MIPEYAGVLDPFSAEAREIVRTSPPLQSLPREVVERAVERTRWKSGKDMLVDFNPDAVRAEVLSFYLMCQGLAAVSHPYSREARMASGATEETVKYRMYDMFKRGSEELCLEVVNRSIAIQRLQGAKLGEMEIPREDYYRLRDRSLAEVGLEGMVEDRTLVQYLPEYAVRWTDLSPLLKHRRLGLARLYLLGGWAVISPRKLWEFYARFVGIRCEEYIASLYERFGELGAPPGTFIEVGERISSLLPPELELRERFARIPGRLKPEFFPPCVQKALTGVGSGGRNYAIIMLLAPFLSYARISPSGKAVERIADFTEDISAIRDEIVPLIFEAAERCNPPLFADQPQEKANVYYHLGFGMTTEPRLEDSGRSKWYRTPNCDKIKTAAPALCEPDELCREIKNPLTYYYKGLSRRGTGD